MTEFPTSRRVREAQEGNRESLAWLVEHLTPLLEAQAAMRLGSLVGRHDPRDLVQEAWLAVIPRLRDLRPRDGRLAPVLVKFLAVTIMHKANHLLRGTARQAPGVEVRTADAGSVGGGLDGIPADIVGPITQAIRSERESLLRRVLAELPPDERRVFILRGIEGLSNRVVAALLGELPNTVAQRYRRVILGLRARLAGSVLEEFGVD